MAEPDVRNAHGVTPRCLLGPRKYIPNFRVFVRHSLASFALFRINARERAPLKMKTAQPAAFSCSPKAQERLLSRITRTSTHALARLPVAAAFHLISPHPQL
jgi:hypothetical protein